jgi:hydroxymethylpyrimidine/phosphomethylpyrimidine kinase
VTAQNTRRVVSHEAVRPETVRDQIRAVVSDMPVGAVKTGMLRSAEIIAAVADELEAMRPDRPGLANLVVDPVIRSTTGARLLDEAGIALLRERLLPLSTLVTPNIPEAEILLGRGIADRGDMARAATGLVELGAAAVLLKGGHLDEGDCPDLLVDRGRLSWLEGARVPGAGAHGTGCVLSASIAAQLALGASLEQACRHAKSVVASALTHAVAVGSGSPVLWPRVIPGAAGTPRRERLDDPGPYDPDAPVTRTPQ